MQKVLRAIGVVAVCDAVGVSAGAGTTATAHRRPNCSTQGVTVDVNRFVRLYEIRYSEAPDDYTARACDLATGKARHIGVYFDEDGGVAGFSLAGPYVAWIYDSCDRYSGHCQQNVSVLNVETGALRRSPTDHRSVFFEEVLPNQHGDAVWIVSIDVAPGSGAPQEVWKLDSQGATRLDSDPAIDPGSLAIAGDRIYWAKGNQAYMARFVN